MGKPKRPCLEPEEQQILVRLEVRLLTDPSELARCDELIVKHHYLHNANLVGEHLRYVAIYKGRWLAVATWSAAAFHLKDRDEFIGGSWKAACITAWTSPYGRIRAGCARPTRPGSSAWCVAL